MERQQFWETLKNRYEEKHRILQQREEELRLKLDALDAIVGCTGPKTQDKLQKTSPVITNLQNVDNTSIKSSPNQPVTSVAASQKTNEEVIAAYLVSDNVQTVYDQSNFKSCTCPLVPPPSEKPGLFNCIWSIFGSTKAKPPPSPNSELPAEGAPPLNQAPPAPPDEPTKENITQSEIIQVPADSSNKYEANVESGLYKNENCMCNPCVPGFLDENVAEKSSQNSRRNGSEYSCNCSICTGALLNTPVTQGLGNVPQKSSQNSNKQGNDNTCNCSIGISGPLNIPSTPNPVNVPEMSSQNPKKQGSGSICNCSVCTRSSAKGKCPCNPTSINVNANLPRNNVDNNGDNIGKNMQQVNTNVTEGNDKPFSVTNLSLKSIDLFYMKNIHELATQERNMLNQINALEKKEKIYEDVLKEYKNVDFCSKSKDSPCPCCNAPTPKDLDSKNNVELKLENFLLRNELKDMKLEIRQYIERMEGPMQFKVETEKYKCNQLEQKLEQAAKEMAEVQELYQKEMNALKLELCTANSNIYNLTAQNAQLTEDLMFFQEKCTKLEEDLIRQKISEAETIQSLQAALNAKPVQNDKDEAPTAKDQTIVDVVNVASVKDECDLHQIARELSKILKECEPCGDCITLPEDLTTTAMLLKSLTDMVDKKCNYGEEGASKTTDLNGTARKTEPKVPAETTGFDKPVEATEKTTKAEAPAATTESLGIIVTQEVTGAFGQGDQISEKISGNAATEKVSKKGSISPSAEQQVERTDEVNQQNETEQDIGSNIDKKSERDSKNIEPDGKSERSTKVSEADKKSERSAKLSEEDKKSQQSVKISETDKKSERSAKLSEADKKSERSVKSSEEDKKSERSARPSEADKKSERSTRRSEVDEKGETGSKKISVSEPTQKPRTSCKCVKSKKSTPPVDQIWPEADKPLVMKDSSVLETTAVPNKEKCDCNVAKKLREQAQIAASKKSIKPCTCSNLTSEETREAKSKHSEPQAVDHLWPTPSERFKVSHQVTASRSKELLKSETSIKCLKVKENFPFDIDTQVDVLNKPPDGIHVTTTITKSGTLEVITEGPEGLIETTLVYTKSGNVEVVTEILEYQSKGKECKKGKKQLPGLEVPEIKALEAPTPEAGPEEEPTGGTEVQSGAFVSPNCQCGECPGLKVEEERTRNEPISDIDSTPPKSDERKSQVSTVEEIVKPTETLEEAGILESQVSTIEKTSKTETPEAGIPESPVSTIEKTSKTGEIPEGSSVTTYNCQCRECLSLKSGECFKETNNTGIKGPEIGSTVAESEQEKSQLLDLPDIKTSVSSKPGEKPEGAMVAQNEVLKSEIPSSCLCRDCPSLKLEETPKETTVEPEVSMVGSIAPDCQCRECPSLKLAKTPANELGEPSPSEPAEPSPTEPAGPSPTEPAEPSPTELAEILPKTEDGPIVEVPTVAANCICKSCPSLQQKIPQVSSNKDNVETKQPELDESGPVSENKNDEPGDVVEETTNITEDANVINTKDENVEQNVNATDETTEQPQVAENSEIIQSLSMSMHVENENDLPAISGEQNETS